MAPFLTRISGVLLLVAAAAGGCTIPVFRYALDRWPADHFGLAADEAWRQGAAGRAFGAAVEDPAVNLSWTKPAADAGAIQLVWPGSPDAVWSGSPGAEAVKPMLSSPVREDVAKRILAGDSAVWVVVESGDAEKDGAFAKRLAGRLGYLQSVAAIPPQDPSDPDSRLGPGPELKVGFSVVRVKRDDPAERFTVRMLAGPKGKELLDGGEPFAAAVFARGRVLGAWDEEALDDAGIDEICLFLLGACSCRVKTLNPGWDLLMSVDWEARLMAAAMAAEGEAPVPAPPPVPDDQEVRKFQPGPATPGE